jgi:hypothetical protein
MRISLSRLRLRLAPAAIVPLLALTGCDKLPIPGLSGADPAKCKQALEVTRRSISTEDFASAQNWREYAWKQCDDRASLEALDKELTAKRTEVETRKREIETKNANRRELLKVFLSWVRSNRADPSRASAAPTCEPPAAGDPKGDKSEDRFCAATRNAGSHAFNVRYYQSQPSAARFTVRLPDATTCEELGAPTVVKTWQVPATGGRSAQRFRCSFTSGPLAGMHAVGSQAVNADLYVFDPTYLDKEPSQKTLLEGN